MSNTELIMNLQEGAKANPAAQAVLLMLSARKRHRSTINLNAICRQLRKEGFDYSRPEYGDVLLWLERMHVGKVTKTKRGKVKGLTDIKYNLPSIGSSALEGTKLDNIKFNRASRYVPSSPLGRSGANLNHPKPKSFNKVLQIAIRESPITITMPDSMNLKTLIGSLNDLIE